MDKDVAISELLIKLTGLTTKKPSETVSYSETTKNIRQVKTSEKDTSVNVPVKYRSIIGSIDQGSLSIFPPPHQYFYSLDEAFNLKSVWYEGYGRGFRYGHPT